MIKVDANAGDASAGIATAPSGHGRDSDKHKDKDKDKDKNGNVYQNALVHREQVVASGNGALHNIQGRRGGDKDEDDDEYDDEYDEGEGEGEREGDCEDQDQDYGRGDGSDIANGYENESDGVYEDEGDGDGDHDEATNAHRDVRHVGARLHGQAERSQTQYTGRDAEKVHAAYHSTSRPAGNHNATSFFVDGKAKAKADDTGYKLPAFMPSTPVYLTDAARATPRVARTQPSGGHHADLIHEYDDLAPDTNNLEGLVNDDLMKNAFEELKSTIAEMDTQLEQFDFILSHMRSNMVSVDEDGTMRGAFDEDDVALWETDAHKVKRIRDAYDSDFGKRIYMYEKKVQDASAVVKRRMQFFNDVNDRFDLLRKRPELMRRMAKKQAELISTLAETQKLLLRDMKLAVVRYKRDTSTMPNHRPVSQSHNGEGAGVAIAVRAAHRPPSAASSTVSMTSTIFSALSKQISNDIYTRRQK